MSIFTRVVARLLLAFAIEATIAHNGLLFAAPSEPEPSPAARRAAVEIRRESLLPPLGPTGRPLPLVSHWNMGGQGQGWTPRYQRELLEAGHHLLPWMAWPTGDPAGDEKSSQRFRDYYEEFLGYCCKLQLPISFRGTQWEAQLVGKPYRALPAQECPAVVTPEGKVIAKLCPFGPVEKWRDPAREYVDTPAMKRVQDLYPDPPLVLFVSNNEAALLRWHQVEELSQRYLDRYGKGRSDEFKRKVVAEGWTERYPVMFQAMRDALVSPAWKKNVRFVGYGAFGPSHLGRWEGWKQYSLATAEATSPNWRIWDGGSPSYYTHNWCDIRDHWVWSTQVESMNWVFQLDEAWKAKPDFWWEISLWDGSDAWKPGEQTPEMLKKVKASQYVKDGQTYTPDRFLGWAQFGMWLLRPRVVREFRGSTTPLEPWRPFFDRLLWAVDRVYGNPTLTEFWRHGRLVPNLAHDHPFQTDIPAQYQGVQRWFLLDTSLDRPRPWTMTTDLPVLSMALVLGEPGSRRWLVYAHSPLEDRRAVEITLPEHGKVKVDVPRAGTFYQVRERDGVVEAVDRR
jgi:hypothetical protein